MQLREELVFHTSEGIGQILFNRPHKLQAFTRTMYERLLEICQEIQKTERVRALVLMGATEVAFSAGTDIAEFAELETVEDVLALEDFTDSVLDALERLPIPTIAAIAGVCSGGGLNLAAACDIRIAAPNARFSLPYGRTMANSLSAGSFERLHALIGAAHLRRLMFEGQPIDAARALTIGLVDEVVNDVGALEGKAGYIARLSISQAPLTLRATKEALLSLRSKVDRAKVREWQERCYASADFREAIDAFLNKRTPHLHGR
ncbi:MAG: enoyl-CoA hydratase/isomerase family protein [Acidobacteriia bacterium]|nr:enoyl-CoA hydratase/isomerase family protein [Methyloceanibacter sp.]MBX5472074.1 enoyl-CoA hydratase/isomerase family protein [Acetobacteraceae bacterium]MCL6490481.1 enoyl-CoA hydratase/isomerase family protein [Terriglobia bacterium]